MSMSKLPMVIVFHLKRFEHGHGKESTKIGSPVKFPEQLDMKPYLAESIASGNGLDAVRAAAWGRLETISTPH